MGININHLKFNMKIERRKFKNDKFRRVTKKY